MSFIWAITTYIKYFFGFFHLIMNGKMTASKNAMSN